MNVRRYIYYSTLISIYTEALVTRFIIDLKVFYLIVMVNFFLLIMLRRFVISKSLLVIYGALIVTSGISIILKTDTITNFATQFVGVFLVSVYFYNFYKFCVDDLKDLFKHYVYLSFIIANIGFVLFLYRFSLGRFEGLYSIMNEPAHYVTVILPAFYYSLQNKSFPRYIYKVLLFSIILSGSSVGYLGLGISFLILPKKLKIIRLIIPLIVTVMLSVGLYFVYPNFRIRIDDTINSLTKSDLSGVNLSTYAFVSNLFVTYQSVSNNPMLGSGIGSHELSHEKYLGDIEGVNDFDEYQNLNAKDANSLFLRVISDMGLFGITFVFIFIIKNYARYADDIRWVYLSRAILLYFFCKLLREGHYFSPEMYFFIFGYYFISKGNKTLNKQQQQFGRQINFS